MSEGSAQSTPQKIKSGRAQTHSSSSLPDSRSQAELKNLVSAEINNQTYEFDPDVVARMLSPKLRKDGKSSSRPSLDEFDCLIDHAVVWSTLQQLPKLDSVKFSPQERDNYDPIVNFLNKCVEGCNEVYDHIYQTFSQDKNNHFKVAKRTDRWFPPHFRFIKYDTSTKDGIQNASPLKPDIVGVDCVNVSPTTNIAAWWGLPRSQGSKSLGVQILIPAEVKAEWSDLVMQSGTYARGQFSATPLRSFTVVIAVNHKKKDLRYLIFHHGGLSASKRLEINVAADSAAIRKIMLSILLWQSAEDAGLPTFTDGQNFLLPAPSTETLNIDRVIYQQSLSIRGRNTYVVKLKTSQVGSSQTPPSQTPVPPYQFRSTTMVQRTKRERSGPRLTIPVAGTRKSPTNSQPNSSGIKERRSNTKTKSGASLSEETFEPISTHEKPRPLTAVRPSRMISMKKHTSLPPAVIVKCSWPNSTKEEMEPSMYQACEDQFGAPDAIISFQACFRKNHPMSNSIFLPGVTEDIGKYHWDVFEPGKPQAAEYRSLWVIVLANEGQTFDECPDASDLSWCLLHSMLGWLSAYQRGYLHRDISIGNLLKLPKTATRKPPNVWGVAYLLYQLLPSEQQKEFGQLIDIKLNHKTASSLTVDKPERVELVKIAMELETILKTLEVTTECRATFTDGDMATYIPNYFKEDSVHNTGTISGTVEFMSTPLLRALEDEESYLQSPLDDLWSFFWTVLWATLHNCFDPGKSDKEKGWRDKLRGERTARDDVANIISVDPTIEEKVEYSLIFRQMAPLLREWYDSLTKMTTGWLRQLAIVKRNNAVNPEVDYLMMFHKTAYTGVLEFVSILSKSNILNKPT